MSKKFNHQNSSKAFTLVESLVAISILMIAIASPMTLAQKGLSTATLSKDQMIASFLAQDAIEAVKNIRDQIAVTQTSGDWLGDKNDVLTLYPCVCSESTCDPSSGDVFIFCKIDTTASIWNSASISAGVMNTDVKLKTFSITDPTTNITSLRYGYIGDNGLDSKFTRYINIIKNPSDNNQDEAAVRVRVVWDTPQGQQNIDIKNFIYNYSENL